MEEAGGLTVWGVGCAPRSTESSNSVALLKLAISSTGLNSREAEALSYVTTLGMVCTPCQPCSADLR